MEPHGFAKRVPDLVLLRYAASLAAAGLADPAILSKAEPDSVALLQMASAAAEAADPDAISSDPMVRKKTVQIATDVYAAIDSIRSSAGGGECSEQQNQTQQAYDLLKQASEAAEAAVQSAAASLVEESPRTLLRAAATPPIAARLAAYVQASGTAAAVKAAGDEAAARAAQIAAGMRATARAAAMDAAKAAAAASSSYGNSIRFVQGSSSSSSGTADPKVAAAAARLASRAAAAASLKEQKSNREYTAAAAAAGSLAQISPAGSLSASIYSSMERTEGKAAYTPCNVAAAAAAAVFPAQIFSGSLDSSRRLAVESTAAQTPHNVAAAATTVLQQQSGLGHSLDSGCIAAAAADAELSKPCNAFGADIKPIESFVSLKRAAEIAIAGATAAAAHCVAALSPKADQAAQHGSDLGDHPIRDMQQLQPAAAAVAPAPVRAAAAAAAAAGSATLDTCRIYCSNVLQHDMELNSPATSLTQETQAVDSLKTDSTGISLDGFFRDDSLGGNSSTCSSTGGRSTGSECWLLPQQQQQQQQHTYMQQQHSNNVNLARQQHPAAAVVSKQNLQQQQQQQCREQMPVKLTQPPVAATEAAAAAAQQQQQQQLWRHQQRYSFLAHGAAAAAPANLHRGSQAGLDNANSCSSSNDDVAPQNTHASEAHGQQPLQPYQTQRTQEADSLVQQPPLQQQQSSCSSSSRREPSPQRPQQQQQQQDGLRSQSPNRSVSWVQALVAQGKNKQQSSALQQPPYAAADNQSSSNDQQQQQRHKQVPLQQLHHLRLQRVAAVAAHMKQVQQQHAELQGQSSHQSHDSEVTQSSELQSELEPVSPDGWRIPSLMQHSSRACSPQPPGELLVKVPAVNSPTRGRKNGAKSGASGVKIAARVMGQQAAEGAAAAAAPVVAATALLGSDSNTSSPRQGQKAPLLKSHTVSHSSRSSYSSNLSSGSGNGSGRGRHRNSSSSQSSVFKQETGRFWQRNSKQKYALCVLLPLLLVSVLVGGGIGAWAWVRKQHRTRSAQAADVPGRALVFQVSLETPARYYPHSCDVWFGDRENLDVYKVRFADAYASVLNIPLGDFKVGSVTCNGTVMTATGSASSSSSSVAPSSRLLLAAAGVNGSTAPSALTTAAPAVPLTPSTAAADTAPGSSSSPKVDGEVTRPAEPTVVITTRFTIAATSSIAASRAQVSRAVDIIQHNSLEILQEDISDFLGVQIIAVTDAGLVDGDLADLSREVPAAAAASSSSSSSNGRAAASEMHLAMMPPPAAATAAVASAADQQQQQDELQELTAPAAAAVVADDLSAPKSPAAAAATTTADTADTDWINNAWLAVWPSPEPARHSSSSSKEALEQITADVPGVKPLSSSSSSSNSNIQQGTLTSDTAPSGTANLPSDSPAVASISPPFPDAQPVEVHSVVSTGANNKPQTNIWLSWQAKGDPATQAAASYQVQSQGSKQNPNDQTSKGPSPTSNAANSQAGSAVPSISGQAMQPAPTKLQQQQQVVKPAAVTPAAEAQRFETRTDRPTEPRAQIQPVHAIPSDQVPKKQQPGALDNPGSSSSSSSSGGGVQGSVPDQSLEEPLPDVFPADLLDPKRHTVAPTCLFAPTSSNSLSDAQGRLWGWMKGTSCLFRKPAVTGVLAPSGITYDSAPICKGTPDGETSMMDGQGKLWGWQNGRSCVYRGIQPTVAVSRGQLPIEKMPMLWEDAPKCRIDPSIENTMPDAFGRLWGEDNGKTCAFKV